MKKRQVSNKFDERERETTYRDYAIASLMAIRVALATFGVGEWRLGRVAAAKIFLRKKRQVINKVDESELEKTYQDILLAPPMSIKVAMATLDVDEWRLGVSGGREGRYNEKETC